MIKVGDIVKTKNKKGNVILPAVVTRVTTYKSYMYNNKEISDVEVLFADGTYGSRGYGKYKETVRHIDIQSVLDQIK